MSTLRVANVIFETTGNNRIHYVGSNTVVLATGGSNSIVSNSTTTIIGVGGSNSIVSNSTTTSLYVGSASVLSVNSTAANVSTNNFYLGSYSNATSGYTVLPNNMKINWGSAITNSVGSNTVTFASAFTTNTYGLSLTIFGSNSAGLSNSGFVRANTINNSGINIITTSNGTLSNTNISAVYYMAIGPA